MGMDEWYTVEFFKTAVGEENHFEKHITPFNFFTKNTGETVIVVAGENAAIELA